MNNRKEKKVFMIELVGIVSVSLCILFLVFHIKGATKYTVSFNSVGGTHITSERVIANKKVSKPTNPEKEGYSFLGWYVGNTAFDFNEEITSNLNLEAKWKKIEESIQENNIKDIQIGSAITVIFSN